MLLTRLPAGMRASASNLNGARPGRSILAASCRPPSSISRRAASMSRNTLCGAGHTPARWKKYQPVVSPLTRGTPLAFSVAITLAAPPKCRVRPRSCWKRSALKYRTERTGPTIASTCGRHMNTAMKRVVSPSTGASITRSARFRPDGGRAMGLFSICTMIGTRRAIERSSTVRPSIGQRASGFGRGRRSWRRRRGGSRRW